MWAGAELLLSCHTWVVSVMKAGVRVYLWCEISERKDKDNSWKLRRFEWNYHHQRISVQMSHVFTYSSEHYTAWTACLLPLSSGFALSTNCIFCFFPKMLIWLNAFEFPKCHVNYNLHSHHFRPLQRRRLPHANHHPLQPEPWQPHWRLLQQLRPGQQQYLW